MIPEIEPSQSSCLQSKPRYRLSHLPSPGIIFPTERSLTAQVMDKVRMPQQQLSSFSSPPQCSGVICQRQEDSSSPSVFSLGENCFIPVKLCQPRGTVLTCKYVEMLKLRRILCSIQWFPLFLDYPAPIVDLKDYLPGR